jgi:hypothetical protein
MTLSSELPPRSSFREKLKRGGKVFPKKKLRLAPKESGFKGALAVNPAF